MRPTLIKTLEDYVGPYYDANNPGMVKVGKEQAMMYGSDDVGPFNLAANERERERENRKYDTYDLIPMEKQKTVKLTKKELVEHLVKTDLGQVLVNKHC